MATKREILSNARGRLIVALYQIEEALNYTDLGSNDSLRHQRDARGFIDDAAHMARVAINAED